MYGTASLHMESESIVKNVGATYRFNVHTESQPFMLCNESLRDIQPSWSVGIVVYWFAPAYKRLPS